MILSDFIALAALAVSIAAFWTSHRKNARDLRLEVMDLNVSLNQDIDAVRRVHADRLKNMQAAFEAAGQGMDSGHGKKFVDEWHRDGFTLGYAIDQLAPIEARFEGIDTNRLENNLIYLKMCKRVFQAERDKAERERKETETIRRQDYS